MAPQTKTVLDHLHAAGTISGVEAAAMYRVRSLTKRIHELRTMGYDIKSVHKTDPVNRQRYVRYVLGGTS